MHPQQLLILPCGHCANANSLSRTNVTAELPQNSLPHRIAIGLNKIALALKSQSWQDATQHSLTPTQGQILTLLRSTGAAGVRLSAVASELGVTAATTSDAVTTLVDKGLVQKARAINDGRAIAISLTPQGLQLAERIADWPDFLLAAVSELSAAEQEVFLKGLIKMMRSLQVQNRISVARMCVNCQFFQPNIYDDPDRPHHCQFVDAAFGDRQLQLDCPDSIPADSSLSRQNWEVLSQHESIETT